MPMMNNTSVGEGLVVLAMMSVIRILRLLTSREKNYSRFPKNALKIFISFSRKIFELAK